MSTILGEVQYKYVWTNFIEKEIYASEAAM